MFDLSGQLTIAVHGGAEGGGLAGGVSGLLSFMESVVGQSPSAGFASLMPGIAAMQNLHPLFVHFPIALLGCFFLVDVAGSLASRSEWRRVASWFLYLGTLFAGATVAAGLAAAGSVAHGGDVHEIMEHHEHLGISVLSLATVLSIWRLLAKGGIAGAANNLYLLLAAILSGLLAFTADLGGLMVYKYGVAVVAADQVNQAAAIAHQHAVSPVTVSPRIEPQPTGQAEVLPDAAEHEQISKEPQAPNVLEQGHSHAHDHHHKH